MVYWRAMDRRSFIGTCTAGAACLAPVPLFAADSRQHDYPRALLVDYRGDPFRAASLRPLTNYVFHYPYVATPVFLLDLGKPALPLSLSTSKREAYAWPGGVGAGRSVVGVQALQQDRVGFPHLGKVRRGKDVQASNRNHVGPSSLRDDALRSRRNRRLSK